MPANIFTHKISDHLGVDLEEAEEIQNVIDSYFNLDWSEADAFEIRTTVLAAYQFWKTT